MDEMAHWISGTGSAPIELSTLVTTAFIDYNVLAFQMNATGLQDLVDINIKSLSADEIIWSLNTKFWSVKAQRFYSTAERKKVYT